MFYTLITGRGYWSRTEQDAQNAWAFDFGIDRVGGTIYFSDKIGFGAHLAVKGGDVGAVPIPPSVLLFGSGLLGLVGIARRKKAA